MSGVLSALAGSFAPAAGGSYLVSVDVSGSTPSGWTDSGTVDWAYTTSPIEGTYSLNCSTGTSNRTYVDFTAQSDVWVFVRCRRDSTPSADDNNLVYIANSSTRQAGIATINGYGGYTVVATAAQSGSGGAVSNGTNAAIWIHFVKNTSIDVWIQTDGSETRPGSQYVASLSGSTSTLDANRLYLPGITGSNTVWDKIRVSTSEIGSSPS